MNINPYALMNQPVTEETLLNRMSSLKTIINRANVNKGITVTDTYHNDQYISYPIILAVNTKLNKFKYLINIGANVNKKDTFLGCTALHYVVLSHDIDKIQLLLESGAKTNVTDNKNRTPLAMLFLETNYHNYGLIYKIISLFIQFHAKLKGMIKKVFSTNFVPWQKMSLIQLLVSGGAVITDDDLSLAKKRTEYPGYPEFLLLIKKLLARKAILPEDLRNLTAKQLQSLYDALPGQRDYIAAQKRANSVHRMRTNLRIGGKRKLKN